MRIQNVRDYIYSINEEALLMDKPAFDNAIVGISEDDRVIYEYDRLVEECMNELECDEEDARSYIDVNILNGLSLHGGNAPIIMMCADQIEFNKK